MAVASTAKFHQNFWGEANAGFDVLLQNMKAGLTASKELGEFLKERIAAEEGYVKGLNKLSKTTSHVPSSTMGSFGPLWEVLKTMCDKLVTVHSQFVKVLLELSREISEYHHSQKEKMKSNMRGEIEHAQESLGVYQNMEAAVHRSKKHYQQCVDHLAKVQGKVERAKAESPSNPKLIALEGRVAQEKSLTDTAKGEYQAAVARHCDHVMEYQGKMSEACVKFESVEEEHLAQMFTFMIKIARTQDSMHVGVAEQFSTLNSQLDVLTVENLLKMFIEEKGTGTEKPTPLKFKPITTPSTNLSASVDDLAADRQNSKAQDKKAKKKLKKKPKNSASNGAVEQSQVHVPENAPEVDEEGYSIRPSDAANISRFPDESADRRASSDSDSSFDDEPESKIKTIKIRNTSTQPVASVDDIKASVMSLRLGAVSPHGIKKATSSQSLNTLNTSTPPTSQRKMSGTSSSHNISDSVANTSQPGVASLIDLDSALSPTAPQMPSPLVPLAPSSKGVQNIPAPLLPTTTSSTVIRGGGSQIPVPLVPSAVPIPTKVSQGNTAPGPSFDPKTIDATASLPVWTVSPQPSKQPSPISPILSHSPTESSSSSPSIPRPRMSSLKNQDPPLLTDVSPLASLPAPPVPTKRRLAGGTGAAPNPALQVPVPVSRKLEVDGSRSDSNSKPNTANSSPVMGSKFSDTDTPPIPSPRGASLLHSPPSASPTHAVSPLATSHISAHSVAADKTMPLAIAIYETCNAIFKGTDFSKCMIKVTGEVVISFPASYLSLVGSFQPLTFSIDSKEKLERVLHNQNLLQKADSNAKYTFDMNQLSSHLKMMQEKASAPFYNVQIIKYEVGVSDAAKLPVQLTSYMKCDANTTNYRMDYTYQPKVFQSKPTLSKVSVSLPVNGGVKNNLTKPVGVWSDETGQMTWMIGDIPPSDNPVPTSLHAKFNLTNGPSTLSSATVTFTCEGDTISGISLDLNSAAYKVSLFKRRCSSGKYTAEPKAPS